MHAKEISASTGPGFDSRVQEAIRSLKNNDRGFENCEYTLEWTSRVFSSSENTAESSAPPTTTEHEGKHIRKVTRCQTEVLSENYENGVLNSLIFFNEAYYELYYPGNSHNVLYRKPMTDATIESLPLIDLRDFGAPSGFGRVWHALDHWTCIEVRENATLYGQTGLLRLTFQSPEDEADIQHQWIFWLSPEHNNLPLHIDHFVQNYYCSFAKIEYAPVPGMPRFWFPRQMEVSILEVPVPEDEYEEKTAASELSLVSQQQYRVRDLRTDSRLCERDLKIIPAVGTMIQDGVTHTLFTQQPYPTMGERNPEDGRRWQFLITLNAVIALALLAVLWTRRKPK